MPANAGKIPLSLLKGKIMQNEYKPTLRFNAAETRRIDAAAQVAGLKSSAWIRKIILDNAPHLSIKDPLAVRVAEFSEPLGWNLINFTEALAFAEANQYADLGEIEAYINRYTKTYEGELWIDCGKVPGVSALDVSSISAKAVDLCRRIFVAHVNVLVASEKLRT